MSRQTANSLRAGTLQPLQEHRLTRMSHQGDVPEDVGGQGDGSQPGSEDSRPQTPLPPDDQGPLAKALTDLARAIATPKSSRTKIREPETFDGSDRNKLKPFLVQCELNFRDRPSAFSNDKAKVTYVLSFLQGSAFRFFVPDLANNRVICPKWETDYDAFVLTLRTNFGPYDAEADAEDKIENLRMKENHRVTQYVVEFNELRSQITWNSSALRSRFYKGLPERLKDEVSKTGKPLTLDGMINLAQQLDARYWERRQEVNREQGSHKPNKTPNNSDKSSPKPNPSSSSSTSQPKPNSGPLTNNSGQKPKVPEKKPSDLAEKLGKDGKLTPAERARRLAHNLCLFCGGLGHTARDCPKSSSNAAKTKARAARAEANIESSTEGSKK
jgi:hypothetical protein